MWMHQYVFDFSWFHSWCKKIWNCYETFQGEMRPRCLQLKLLDKSKVFSFQIDWSTKCASLHVHLWKQTPFNQNLMPLLKLIYFPSIQVSWAFFGCLYWQLYMFGCDTACYPERFCKYPWLSSETTLSCHCTMFLLCLLKRSLEILVREVSSWATALASRIANSFPCCNLHKVKFSSFLVKVKLRVKLQTFWPSS